MALGRLTGSRLAGTTQTIGGETVDIPFVNVALVDDDGSSAAASSSAAFTSVSSSTTSATLLALNLNRKGAAIVNTDANILYIDATGGTASATRHTAQVASGGMWECPFGYTGLITGIWAANGSGAALVTEFS